MLQGIELGGRRDGGSRGKSVNKGVVKEVEEEDLKDRNCSREKEEKKRVGVRSDWSERSEKERGCLCVCL